MHTVCFR